MVNKTTGAIRGPGNAATMTTNFKAANNIISAVGASQTLQMPSGGSFKFLSLGLVPEWIRIDDLNKVVVIGDVQVAQTGTALRVDETNRAITMVAGNGISLFTPQITAPLFAVIGGFNYLNPWIDLNDSTRTLKLGDAIGESNGTRIELNDGSGTINFSAVMGSVDFVTPSFSVTGGGNYANAWIRLSDSLRTLTLGDNIGENNSTQISINDNVAIIELVANNGVFVTGYIDMATSTQGVKTSKLSSFGGASPTGVPGAGAGTGGTAFGLSITGNDMGGRISLTTRSTGIAGSSPIVIVTFNTPFVNQTPRAVLITPGSSSAKNLSGTGQVFVDSVDIDTSGFIITSGTALAPSTNYVWYYIIIE